MVTDKYKRTRDDYTTGPQSIRQRGEPCRCGCRGTDSWHALHLARVVRDIVFSTDPQPVGEYAPIATGTYRHPSGEVRECVLFAFRLSDGRENVCGWRREGV